MTGIASGQNLNKDVTIFINVRTSKPGKWVLDIIGNGEKYENSWTRIGKGIYRVDSNGKFGNITSYFLASVKI